MNFSPDCKNQSCQSRLNLYWYFCPWCGMKTGLQYQKERDLLDSQVKYMKERHELLRSADQGEEDLG